MYCVTYVNSFNCVINELNLWSDISSEHPTFIKTVADLTNKNLPKEITEKLTGVKDEFEELKRMSEALKKQMHFNPANPYVHLTRLKELVRGFLHHDRYAIQTYDEVRQYGKEDKVWQTLLEHISEEQEFMYNLFMDINNQLNQYVNV